MHCSHGITANAAIESPADDRWRTRRVLVTREIAGEAIKRLTQHFVVESNQQDRPVRAQQFIRKLKGKDGVVTLTTDIVNEAVLAKNPQLKIVSNVAVGYNNLDVVAAATEARRDDDQHARCGRRHDR